jgi:copper(I)-binding protein
MMRISAVLGLFFVFFSTAMAHDHGIHIEQSWARTSAPGAPSAGFMMVKNSSDIDDVLMSVSGDFAKKLELHLTKSVDGVMKMMHQKDGIVIPAGDMVHFKPGSYHLMFMGLDKNFEKGETYTVELTFKNAGTMIVELPVREMQPMGMEHKH